MTLVPALLDLVGDDPERGFRPNAGFWSNQQSDGRGFDIQVQGKRLSVAWYTYDQQGMPTWYLAAGALVDRAFSAPLLRFELDAQGNSSRQQVGSLELEFAAPRRAAVSWSVGRHQRQRTAGLAALQHRAGRPRPYRRLGPRRRARVGPVGSPARPDQRGGGFCLRWRRRTPLVDFTTGRRRMPGQFTMQASFSDSLCPGCGGTPDYQFLPAGVMTIELPDAGHDGGSWSSDV